MNRRDAAGVVLLCGVVALASSISGAVLDFLRPSMRPWVGIAGAILASVGAVELWRSRGAVAHDHHAPPRLGWLVVVPIAVGLTVGAGSLGVYAVGRNATYATLPEIPSGFDLENYVRSASYGGQPIEITLVDLSVAASAPDTRALLRGHDLRLVGFLARDGGEVRLSRFVISCCAADAIAVQVVLDGGADLPADGTWVEVVASLAPDAADEPTGGGSTDLALPHLEIGSVRTIAEPRLPYELPVSRIGG